MDIVLEEIKQFCNSCYYVGGKNWIKDFCNKKSSKCYKLCGVTDETKIQNFERIKDKIRLHLKNYLQLDNVSFLFGTGASMHLGTISIRRIPKQIEEKINGDADIRDLFKSLILKFQNGDNDNIKRSSDDLKEIDTPLENFINYLLALKYVLESSKDIKVCDQLEGQNGIDKLNRLIETIKKELFKLCDLDNLPQNWFLNIPKNKYIKDEMDNNGKYCYHKQLIKSLLQRPLNLKRVNIFTTNYDLAFENAFDELGINYIDGFTGFNKRSFRPETYDYDIYYPGSTTEGKVRRIERVIKYYKLHGSITWMKEKPTVFNQYGLTEKTIEYIRNKMDLAGEMIIYPTACKKGYTLNFPYSELFRQFSAAITQPQSVLFCIGYSFFDEHINDIIFQALSLPSFTLVVVDYIGSKGNSEILKLKNLNDPRIIILEGEYLGDFKHFSKNILPNMHEIDIRENIFTTLKKLHDNGLEGDNDV